MSKNENQNPPGLEIILNQNAKCLKKCTKYKTAILRHFFQKCRVFFHNTPDNSTLKPAISQKLNLKPKSIRQKWSFIKNIQNHKNKPKNSFTPLIIVLTKK